MKMLVKRECTVTTNMIIEVSPQDYCQYNTGKINLNDNLIYIDKSCINEINRRVKTRITEINPYTKEDERELQRFYFKRQIK